MTPDFLLTLPAEVADCYRILAIKRNHHWKVDEWTLEALQSKLGTIEMCEGGEDQFKEMLPPFLELTWRAIKHGGFFAVRPLTVLHCYNWRVWPAEEQEAVTACLALLWRVALEQNNGYCLSELLTTAQHIELSWLPFLEAWFATPLSSVLVAEALPLRHPERISDEAREWLSQPPLMARVEADFFAAPDAEAAEEIGRLYDLLARWTAIR